MKLDTEFYKLPVTFDPNLVYEEICRVEPYRWVPRGNPRYLSLPLVSHHGLDTQHPSAPTWPTDNLERCPYLRQVLSHFRSPLTDVRVRRVEPGTSSAEYYDEHYAGFTRYRLHLPLLTDPRIVFRCNGREVHMERGEVWLFDRLALYGIVNPTRWPRVHISIETCGSSTLWNMIERAERPFGAPSSSAIEPERIEYREGCDASVLTENTPGPAVLPPGDLDCFLADLLQRVRLSQVRDRRRHAELVSTIRRFQHDWRTLWSLMGPDTEGWPRYRSLAMSLLREVAELDPEVGSDLKPGLTVRVHDFLRTGAINPRMSSYQIDEEATPDQIYELIGEPLMRLRADGVFEVWNSLHKQYRAIAAEDIDLLRWFSKPVTVAEAAEGAGYEVDADLLRRVSYFVLQHLIRPLRALPGVAPPDFVLPPRGPSVPNDDDALAPAWSTTGSIERFPVRMADDIYFRLRAGNRDVFVWVPQLHGFRTLNWYWLRLIAALTTGVTPWEAADVAGLRYDDQVESAIGMLLHHGLLVETHQVAAPRRARAGSR
jgi:hypothetical protein